MAETALIGLDIDLSLVNKRLAQAGELTAKEAREMQRELTQAYKKAARESEHAAKLMAHAMISDGPPKGAVAQNGQKKDKSFFTKLGNLMRTHPPLDERVEALQAAVEAGLVPAKSPQPASSFW